MQRKLVLVNAQDNVLICCQTIEAQEHYDIDSENFTSPVKIGVGHKVANQDISKGDKVLRYGAPIGSAIVDIAKGEHVHLHNMKSDYIASHTRQSKVGDQ